MLQALCNRADAALKAIILVFHYPFRFFCLFVQTTLRLNAICSDIIGSGRFSNVESEVHAAQDPGVNGGSGSGDHILRCHLSLLSASLLRGRTQNRRSLALCGAGV